MLVNRAWPAVIVVAAALIAGCSNSGRQSESAPPAGSSWSAPAETASPSSGLPASMPELPGADVDEPTPAAPPPIAQAAVVATRFAAAWARPRLAATRWTAELTPWCEEGFAAGLRLVDPANVPASRVTGPLRAVAQSPGLITYTVPTDAGVLTVVVAAIDGKWLVTNNDFTRAKR